MLTAESSKPAKCRVVSPRCTRAGAGGAGGGDAARGGAGASVGAESVEEARGVCERRRAAALLHKTRCMQRQGTERRSAARGVRFRARVRHAKYTKRLFDRSSSGARRSLSMGGEEAPVVSEAKVCAAPQAAAPPAALLAVCCVGGLAVVGVLSRLLRGKVSSAAPALSRRRRRPAREITEAPQGGGVSGDSCSLALPAAASSLGRGANPWRRARRHDKGRPDEDPSSRLAPSSTLPLTPPSLAVCRA